MLEIDLKSNLCNKGNTFTTFTISYCVHGSPDDPTNWYINAIKISYIWHLPGKKWVCRLSKLKLLLIVFHHILWLLDVYNN